MILGKLNLTEETDLDFSLEIFGTSETAQTARLVIENKGFDISCHCEMINGEVKAKIPKLKGILPAGVYESRLEIVVGDKIFTPLKEQIEINPLVEFDVTPKKPVPVKEGVKVSVKAPMVSEDSRNKTGMTELELNIQKAIKEGYEVSKVNDNYIMKKGELYAGLISEQKILVAKKEYATLSELLDGLS